MYIDLSMFSDCNDSNKITVDYLAIKANNMYEDKYYYTIIYHPINSEDKYEGYGSYSLSVVCEWLGEYFTLI
jgi:hypothetical protein|nr:MAG TPA: hypothetical protein [Caudoviricetes sp.]